jgi:hypothetical protein
MIGTPIASRQHGIHFNALKMRQNSEIASCEAIWPMTFKIHL